MEIPGYKMQRLIAEGGMASVYLGVQVSLRRRIALKEMNNRDFGPARLYVHRGTGVQSEHEELLALDAEFDEMQLSRSEMQVCNQGTGDIARDFKSMWRTLFN